VFKITSFGRIKTITDVSQVYASIFGGQLFFDQMDLEYRGTMLLRNAVNYLPMATAITFQKILTHINTAVTAPYCTRFTFTDKLMFP
jgi:hypothetical protein